MITDNPRTGASYIEWSTVLAGAVLASAVSLVFLQFGSAIGLANIDSLRDNVADVSRAGLLNTAVFILVVQVLASVGGGYVAGRMRAPISTATPHESEVRDGVHGLLAWATATLAVMAGAAVVAAFAHLAVAPTPETQLAEAIVQREQAVTAILAFAAAATSAVSALSAWIAAVKGGDHRDRNVDFSRHMSFLVRR